MRLSMSITKGKGNQKHNTRTQTTKPKNVDFSRTKDNLVLADENIRDVYHQLFDSALEKYNAKQKRNDRKIKDYYSKIANSKQEKLFHELVVQIGNIDKQTDHETTDEIYREFVEEFQRNNPQMKVIGAYVHNDEATPHLHLDYVPYSKNNKRGLETKVSNDRAIKQMGYHSWLEWKDRQFEILERIAMSYDIEREGMNNTERHRTVEGYKQEQRAIEDKLNNLSKELETSSREPKKSLLGKETIDYSIYRVLEQENTLQKAQISNLSAVSRKQEENIEKLKNKPYVKENEHLKQDVDKLRLENNIYRSDNHKYRRTITSLKEELGNEKKKRIKAEDEKDRAMTFLSDIGLYDMYEKIKDKIYEMRLKDIYTVIKKARELISNKYEEMKRDFGIRPNRKTEKSYEFEVYNYRTEKKESIKISSRDIALGVYQQFKDGYFEDYLVVENEKSERMEKESYRATRKEREWEMER